MNTTNVFVFEYVSCYEKLQPEIVVEGLAMFSTLMRDFNEFARAFSISTPNSSIVESKISSYFSPFWLKDIRFEEKELEELFKDGCESSDFVSFIAPENEGLLYKLAKIADKHNSLCSPAKAIEIAADKWKTYKKLKNCVNFPETSLKPLDGIFVAKPRVSCGGEGIELCKVKKGDIIYQRYIKGRNLSVSFIAGDEVKILSINEQILNGFSYTGGKIVKVDAFAEKKIEEIVEIVAEKLGLFGYCGIDLIYAEELFVVDVNARLTTSSVMLKECGLNLGKLMLDNYYGKLEVERVFKPIAVVKKSGNLELVEFKNCVISLEKV